MSFTATTTQTNTYTDARLKAVMPEVGADFYAMAAANLISYKTAESWTEDLIFVLQHQAAYGFQVQLRRTGAPTIALDYRVSSDGTIRESSTGGGIDYYALPAGTTASLFVDMNYSAAKIATVNAYTASRGWSTNGSKVQGASERDRAYSNNGYGVIRNRIGTWPS